MLPREIIFGILRYLDLLSLVNVSAVSKKFREKLMNGLHN